MYSQDLNLQIAPKLLTQLFRFLKYEVNFIIRFRLSIVRFKNDMEYRSKRGKKYSISCDMSMKAEDFVEIV